MSSSFPEQAKLANTSQHGFRLLALGSFGLIAAAAGLLWWRFGTAVFLDSLNAVWTCI